MEIIKRTLSGIVYILIIIIALFSNNLLVYRIVFSTIIFAAIFEYSNLVKNNYTRPLRSVLDAIAGVYLFCVVSYDLHSMVMFLPYMAYIVYIFVRAIYTENKNLIENLSKTLLGQLYICGGFSLANMMVFKGEMPYIFLALTFFCIWANDTGAYLIGSKFGKRRLFQSISPKKSWEGFFGGLLFSVVMSIVVKLMGVLPSEMSIFNVGVLGCLISTFATLGDLFESALKRNMGVKDSGNIIPGHGGILDRIDSALFALPAVVLYLYFVSTSLFV